MKKIKVALSGSNGHQIEGQIRENLEIELVAVHDFPLNRLKGIKEYEENRVKVFDNYDELLEKSGAELISLCALRRSEQADYAIKALRKGINVYSEKPSCLSIQKLDEVLAIAKKNNVHFREMADTVYQEPYYNLRKYLESNPLGKIVQVYSQKSYPLLLNGKSRPHDENIDGGLLLQVGVHAIRMIEHTTSHKVESVVGYETNLSVENEGELKRAVSLSMTLDNGGIASSCINYCNTKSFGLWGNECLRIFGEKGFLEITDGGQHTKVYLENEVLNDLPKPKDKAPNHLNSFIDLIKDKKPMMIGLDDELHPLRVVIEAKKMIASKAKNEERNFV